MKKMIIALVLLAGSTSWGAKDYVWEKQIGNNRVERGIVRDFFLDYISGSVARIAIECAADEVLVNGGCSVPYGLTLTGSMPFTSSVAGSSNTWVCVGREERSTALTKAGNTPAADTPSIDLWGSMQAIITCEKK